MEYYFGWLRCDTSLFRIIWCDCGHICIMTSPSNESHKMNLTTLPLWMRSVAAIHLCILVKKPRVVGTVDRVSLARSTWEWWSAWFHVWLFYIHCWISLYVLALCQRVHVIYLGCGCEASVPWAVLFFFVIKIWFRLLLWCRVSFIVHNIYNHIGILYIQ